MAAAHHPTDDVLSNYGLGKLAGRESETVEGHISTCLDCRRRVAELSSDGFLDRLQRAARPERLDGFEPSRPVVEKSTPFVAIDANIPPALLTLETYTDIRRLGHGGMGEIFLAKNVRMGREEVLKVMSRSLLERTGAVARFEREIRSIGKLNHPNIVTSYAAQQVGDTVVLSMEYAGEDMAKMVEKRGPLSVSRACYFVHQAALGLQYSHEKNLVHRDIKPSNLMVLQNGTKWQVKILDFGLAKSRVDPNAPTADPEEHAHHTKTGQSLGTPSYMAPEQYRNAKSVDIRADIYALGCTLHFLLTGRPPFVEEHPMALLFAHAEKVPEPVRGRRADVPAALDELIATLLAKDPKDRLQTPAELAKALVPFFKPPAKPPAKPPTSTDLDETSLPDGTESSKVVGGEPAPPKRKRWPAVALGLLVLALVGVGSLFIQTKDGTIELTDLDPAADVFVDGNKVTVKWADGQQSAEVSVKPGTRKIEVKRGDVTVLGESVEIASNGRKVLTARQKVEVPPVKPGDDEQDDIPLPVEKTKLDPGFTPLFNGKDLTNWTRTGNQDGVTANVANSGTLVIRHQGAKGKMPTTLLLSKPGSNYRHFHLRIQGFPAGGPGAALYLFAGGRKLTGPGAQFRVSLGSTETAGEEIGRAMRGGPNDAAPLLKEVTFGPRQPYTMDVILQGNRLTVDVNGQRTADVTEDALPAEPGDIKLHVSAGSTARFTAIEIKPLPANPEFISLFNGKDLTGWTIFGNPKANWSVRDGAIVGEWPRGLKDDEVSGGTNIIPDGNRFRNFHLRFEASPSQFWGSRIYLFGSKAGRPPYRIMLGSPQNAAGDEVGRLSVRGMDVPYKTRPQLIPTRPWNTIDAVVQGNRITVEVNGTRTADYTDDEMPKQAGLVIFHCAGNGRIRYRNIEIQELPDPRRAEAAPVKVPADGRTAAIGNGQWVIDGDVLKQTAEAKGPAGLNFGDAAWTNYDYSVDVRWQTSAAQVVYRAESLREKSLAFVRGKTDAAGQSLIGLETHSPAGDLHSEKTFGPKIVLREWHTMKVSVRNNQATISVNGQEACVVRGLRHPAGRVGVRTYDGSAEFKNFRVTDPAGKLLWEGLPELPAP